jgi:hypothetical protein
VRVAVAELRSGAPGFSRRPAEIIITANRREVSLQKSSLAIETFSHEELENAVVSQAVDPAKLVQGLQVGFEGTPS